MVTQNWCLFFGFGVTDKPFLESSNITRWRYSQPSISKARIFSQALQIPMDRLCRLTISFQNQKHKIQTTFLRTSFLRLQTIRLARSCTPTHWNSYVYSCTYEKTYLAVHFTNRLFLFFFWQKICEFNAKIFSACWTYKSYIKR